MTSNRTSRGRRGTSTVEFAFIALVLFLFVFGVVEYGRLVMTLQLMNTAAREGARSAVVSQSSMSTTQIQSVVTSYLAGQDVQLKSLTISVYQVDPSTGNNLGSWTSAGFGQAIAVQVKGNYTPMLPSFLLMGSSIPLQAEVIMYSEAD